MGAKGWQAIIPTQGAGSKGSKCRGFRMKEKELELNSPEWLHPPLRGSRKVGGGGHIVRKQ